MAIVDGWVTWAIRYPGPPVKKGYSAFGQTAPKRGIVPHSVVGSLAAALAVLENTELVGGRYKHGSWQFTNAKDGKLYQHYPVLTNCWHGGDVDDDDGVRANVDLVGIEHEGGPPGNVSEPLTEAQIATLARLYQEFEDGLGFAPYERRVTVWEHNEVSDSGTQCPSGRIPHDEIKRRTEEEAMASPEYDKLVAVNEYQNKILVGMSKQLADVTAANRAQNDILVNLAKRVTALEGGG